MTPPPAGEGAARRWPWWARALLCVGAPSLIVLVVVGPLPCGALVDRPEAFAPELLRQVESALVVYAARNRGQYPERLEDATRYFEDGRVPVDPWGRPLLYQRLPADQGARGYVLISLGADGLPGDQGGGPDLVVWRVVGVEAR